MPSPIVEKATSGHCVNHTSFIFSHAQSSAGKFMWSQMQSRREYNPFHNTLDTSKKVSIKP